MGPVFYAITILGCADGSARCTPLTTLPAQYSSEQECKAGASEALILNSKFDFPTLVAECSAYDTRLIAADESPKEIPAGARRG